MNNQKFFRVYSERNNGGGLLEKSYSKIVHADVVLLPALDCDDVLYLRNEPVYFCDEPIGSCNWVVQTPDGTLWGVSKVRREVFLGYYVDLSH